MQSCSDRAVQKKVLLPPHTHLFRGDTHLHVFTSSCFIFIFCSIGLSRRRQQRGYWHPPPHTRQRQTKFFPSPLITGGTTRGRPGTKITRRIKIPFLNSPLSPYLEDRGRGQISNPRTFNIMGEEMRGGGGGGGAAQKANRSV